jgi:hypothetical protein
MLAKTISVLIRLRNVFESQVFLHEHSVTEAEAETKYELGDYKKYGKRDERAL